MNSRLKTAVIGAGPSGLTTCKVLKDHGIPVDVYEASSSVGGQWSYAKSNIKSGMYDSLRVNTSKSVCRFSDFELPDHYADYPGHGQMLAWFEEYAEHFHLYDHIHLKTAVTDIQQDQNGQWSIATEHGDMAKYDHIVVSTGYNQSFTPHIRGNFAGETLHSQDYINPLHPIDCHEKKILIIGLGNTACDLAVELSNPQLNCEVSMSVRSPRFFIPRLPDKITRHLPHPSQQPNAFLKLMPNRFINIVSQYALPLVVRILGGDSIPPQQLGLPKAPKQVTPFNLVISNDFLPAVKERGIEIWGEIDSAQDFDVKFKSGATKAFDVVLFATGYQAHFPFLNGVLDDDFSQGLELYNGTVHPKFPGLFFVGFLYGNCARWSISEQQAKWVAKKILQGDSLKDSKQVKKSIFSIFDRPASNCQHFLYDLSKK